MRLFAKVITISLETVRIVEGLRELGMCEKEGVSEGLCASLPAVYPKMFGACLSALNSNPLLNHTIRPIADSSLSDT